MMNLLSMLPKGVPIWPLVEQALVSNGVEDQTILTVLQRVIEGGKPTHVEVLSSEPGDEIIEVRRENDDETVTLTVHCQRKPAKEVDNQKAA